MCGSPAKVRVGGEGGGVRKHAKKGHTDTLIVENALTWLLRRERGDALGLREGKWDPPGSRRRKWLHRAAS
jgi:hypothetical protein